MYSDSGAYGIIFTLLGVSILLALVIYFLAYGLASQLGDSEKISSYECGFDPFEDSRVQFDVHFYLVAMLFIVFDREAIFIYPWALSLSHLGSVGLFSMRDFLLELLIGYLYVWALGALEVLYASMVKPLEAVVLNLAHRSLQ